MQIDMFESNQLSKEREKLIKMDSLTVLDYIRTSIEILMNMNHDEDKEKDFFREGGRSNRFARNSGEPQRQRAPLGHLLRSLANLLQALKYAKNPETPGARPPPAR